MTDSETKNRADRVKEYMVSVLSPICTGPIAIDATDADDGITLVVRVSAKDRPLIIGREGVTAKSIRQLLSVYGLRHQCFVRYSVL